MFPVGGVFAFKTKWKMSVSRLFGISSRAPAASSQQPQQPQPQQPAAPAAPAASSPSSQQQQQPAAAAAADKHQGNKELKNIFYVSGLGRICSQDKMENVSFRAIW